MQPVDIKALIEQGLPGADVILSGDGCHAAVTVVSAQFEGKSMLAQQRMVYATVDAELKSGAIHALSIKTYTPAQWQALAKNG